jgi:hypothetical protein
MIALVLVVAWLASPAVADRDGEMILNPKTYTSPSGAYVLDVDPGTIYGLGEGTYRLTRDGAEVWAGTRPFTLREAVITDNGFVAGYACAGNWNGVGPADQVGRVCLVIIGPDGSQRLNTGLPQRDSSEWGYRLDLRTIELVADAGNDRLLVRSSRPGLRLSSGETWQIFALSDGTFVDEFDFGHPEEDENTYWGLQTMRPIAGTPLLLVYWMYAKWGEYALDFRDVGAECTLINWAGELVWTQSFPGDYMEPADDEQAAGDEQAAAEVQRRRRIREWIRENGVIVEVDQPGQFDVFSVKAAQRITFRVERDGEDGWRVTEVGREDFDVPAAAPDLVTTQPAPPDPLTLPHVGTITLEPESQPLPEVRDVTDFELDDEGRIAVLRGSTDETQTLLLVEPGGTVAAALDPRELLGQTQFRNLELACLGRNRWLLAGTTWDVAGDGQRTPIARVWTLETPALRVRSIVEIRESWLERVAGNGRGGFVAIVDDATSRDAKTYVAMYDGEGNETWRFVPDSDWLDNASGLVVTSEGQVIIPYCGGRCVSVLDADGTFRRCDECSVVFGEEGAWMTSVAPDHEGGVYVHFEHGPIWHVHSDWSYQRKLWIRCASGWKVDVARNGVRVDAAGKVWTTDGACLMCLDDEDVVDRVIGESPETPALRRVSDVAVGADRMICVVEQRNRFAHVFDSAGRRVRILRPSPEDSRRLLTVVPDRPIWEGSWAVVCPAIDVAADGRIFVGGLEFSPSGERIGFRKPPEGTDEPDQLGSGVFYQPSGGRCWVVSTDGVKLVGDDNTVLRTIHRRPDRCWLDTISAAAFGPDGGLAVASAASWLLAPAPPGVSTYGPTGEPLVTAPPPNVDYEWKTWRTLAYNGRYVLTGPHGGEDGRRLLLDTAANPPKWYEVDSLAPYDDRWRAFFVHDGRELWMFAENARKVERFALPAGSSAQGTD